MKPLTLVSDSDLLAHLNDNVSEERERLIVQLRCLAELERRKYFLHYQSLWHLLTEELGMEESVAYRRIRGARLLLRFPELEEKLESGRLNLSLLLLVEPHLEKCGDEEERTETLASIEGLSYRSAERVLARRSPERNKTIPRERVRPIDDDLNELLCVVSDETLEGFEKLRGLLAHSHPEGLRFGEMIGTLMTDYLKRHHPEERAKRAMRRRKKPSEAIKTVATSPGNASPETNERAEDPTPSPPEIAKQTGVMPNLEITKQDDPHPYAQDKRRPSQSLRHFLILRDGYHCAYRDPVTQKCCGSTYRLQVDHRIAWARGGVTELSNLRLYCRSHNLRAGIQEFGLRAMKRRF